MKPDSHLGSFLAHAVVLEDVAASRYEELAEAIRIWLKRYPQPDPGWDEDLDPPVEVE